MEDLLVRIYQDTLGKPSDYQKAYLSGIVSGLKIQLELAKAGELSYDGYLMRVLFSFQRKTIQLAFSDLGEEKEKILSPNLINNWECSRDEFSRVYFTQMGVGQIHVCHLVGLLGLGAAAAVVTTMVNHLSKMIEEV